jgi:formylglycine-generating enzyme required for sulfatase activity
MMCVEGGTMYIGRGDTVNRPYRQRPLRQVTVSDFYLGQTEVTQELWMAIMGENHSLYQCDTCLCHPVDSVSIDEVLLFVERLNSLTGYNFRLPTEAEWEYAARGGVRSKGYAYAGSDNVNEVAWCRVSENQGGTTHPVAQKRPNELGLYDMHGNLYEFVHDKFVDNINIYPSVNPTGPEGIRGSATGCGSAYYSTLMPENTWGWVGTGGGRSRWFGFRLALSDQDPFAAITIGKYRFHMMYVKGGTFMMGSDAPDAEKDEKPVHEVTLSDYYIGQTEVTQKLWKLVMGNNNNPSANQGDELPVTNISRADCQTFVEKLSELTGLRFRLPTEAEWEYAARGGQNSKGYVYAGSNDINEVAWYPSNCQKPQAVGQKKPNELGIYDMSGNVYEFCYDWYGAYPAEPQTNPQGPSAASNGYRSCRGGCWQKQNKGDDASYCRIANRGHDIKGNERIGLRIVLEK